MNEPRVCELCGRAVSLLTRHHLIPRTRHHNKRNKRVFDRAEVRHRILWICRACHNQVHAVLTEKELERDYNNREALAAHPEIRKFIDWIRTRPETAGFRSKATRRSR